MSNGYGSQVERVLLDMLGSVAIPSFSEFCGVMESWRFSVENLTSWDDLTHLRRPARHWGCTLAVHALDSAAAAASTKKVPRLPLRERKAVSKHKDGAWNQAQYTDITNKSVDSDTLRTGPQVPGICNVKGWISPINHQWLILKRAYENFGNLVIVMVAVGCRKCQSLYQSYS